MNKDKNLEIKLTDIHGIAQGIIDDFMSEKGITELTPANFTFCLRKAARIILANKRILKHDNPRFNEYDKRKVLYLYGVYKDLCLEYSIVSNLYGFCEFSGIPKQNIYNWRDNTNINTDNINNSDNDLNNSINDPIISSNIDTEYRCMLNSGSFDLIGKIHADNEESLFMALGDRRLNPMHVLPALNHYHGWTDVKKTEIVHTKPIDSKALLEDAKKSAPSLLTTDTKKD